MPGVFTFSPSVLSYASANVIAGGTAFPLIGAGPTQNFPKANCRQVVILNTGATTLYFGSVNADSWASVPSPFNPASPGIAPVLGFNCTQIPAGGSFSIELDTYQKRGSFDPAAFTANEAAFLPCTIIFFAAAPATNATALLTYINNFGPF